ncbi:MAG: hypothetical protein U0073_00760 [Bacteroidia bacterium]
MNKHIKSSVFLVLNLVLFLSFLPQLSVAQRTGYVQVNGKVRQNNRPIGGVIVKITCPGTIEQTVTSKDNGTYVFNLDLQKNYTITFEKPGLVSKKVEFNTVVPPDQSDIIYQNEFAMDLFEDVAGVSQNASMGKAVAKISYNPTYEDFVHDPAYTKQIQNEQDQARKAAEELNRMQERARLDSLNKLWNDSLAKVKAREAQMLAAKAEQDRLKAEQEKARQDSIARATADAAAKALALSKEQARLDSISKAEAKAKALADARDKARQDSIAKAEADQAKLAALAQAREKARQDSISRAQAEQSRKDSLARVKADADAKALAEAKLKADEKARKDSIQKAEADAIARKKAEQDSISQAQMLAEKARLKAEADLKAREKASKDSTARAEALAEARKRALADSLASAEAATKAREKQREDSISRAQTALKDRQKFVADSTAKAVADAKARLIQETAAREKAKQDSISRAQLAEAQAKADADRKQKEAEENKRLLAAQEKAKQDSTAKAEADRLKNEALAKSQAENEAKAKAEEERIRKQNEEKNRQDSIATAQRLKAEKDEQDRRAKALAEIEAKKQLLSKTNAANDDKSKAPPKPAAVPKIKDSDYHEGITEETVNESSRTIYRTVVKIDGTAINYQKIVYNWGGVFYFKNESNLTQSLFDQEIKNAKTVLNK